jgi:hypothetical protein
VPEPGHGLGQAPIGDGHAHAALDDSGFCDLHLSFLKCNDTRVGYSGPHVNRLPYKNELAINAILALNA